MEGYLFRFLYGSIVCVCVFFFFPLTVILTVLHIYSQKVLLPEHSWS